MKKTLAIVLAVLMAVAALSSFAFVIGGSTEVKADFEIVRIFAADIDLTQAGIRAYEKIEPSTDYWTPGKSLCIAVEFRVWNRTLDGHAGAAVDTVYSLAVESPTANVSFAQYAVTKVASYVVINGTKQLSHVSALPLSTVTFNPTLNAAVFNVKILKQITPDDVAATGTMTVAKLINTDANAGLTPGFTAVNVYNTTLLGLASVKGYVATVAWKWNATGGTTGLGDIDTAQQYALNTIGVPVLKFNPGYLTDPQYVDYVVFLSARHNEANAEGLGELNAYFTVGAAEGWKTIAAVTDLQKALGTFTSATLVAHATKATLNKYYGIPLGAGGVTVPGAYTKLLVLSELGYVIVRSEYTVTVPAGSPKLGNVTAPANRDLLRYDVFRFDPANPLSAKRYVASYVTEDMLSHGDAKAIMLEYNGSEVALNMLGNYIMSNVAPPAAWPITNDYGFTLPITPIATATVPAVPAEWVLGAALNVADNNQLQEIADLNKMHTDFATGIGQSQGYPILDDQFTANLAQPKKLGLISNTYLAGTTVAVEVADVDEGTVTDEELPPEDGELVEDGEVDVPTAGDATIAFVCAAAAILACAALAFVMKKAR